MLYTELQAVGPGSPLCRNRLIQAPCPWSRSAKDISEKLRLPSLLPTQSIPEPILQRCSNSGNRQISAPKGGECITPTHMSPRPIKRSACTCQFAHHLSGDRLQLFRRVPVSPENPKLSQGSAEINIALCPFQREPFKRAHLECRLYASTAAA